jgi:hypothetical protein
MLEQVDFSAEKMSKEDYKAVYKELVKKLVVLQQQARSAGVGLVVLFEGWGGAGKDGRGCAGDKDLIRPRRRRGHLPHGGRLGECGAGGTDV